MRKRIFSAAFLLAAAVVSASSYPYRWVYVSRSLGSDAHVEEIRRIVETAASHGLNGMVLSAGLDRLLLQKPDYFRRLERVKRICGKNGIELIPMIFSVGYGGSVLAHDRNLAAGLRDHVYELAQQVCSPGALRGSGREEVGQGTLRAAAVSPLSNPRRLSLSLQESPSR